MVQNFGISASDAVTFCRSRNLADYFETCVHALARHTGQKTIESGPLASGWILTQVLGAVQGRDEEIPSLSLSPQNLAEVLFLLDSGKIKRTRTRQIIEHILASSDGVCIADLAKTLGEKDGQNAAFLDDLCDRVLGENSLKVEQFNAGKSGLLNYFVGQVMSRCGGRLEAEKIRKKLLKKLKIKK